MTVVTAILITHFVHDPVLAFTVVSMGRLFQILWGAVSQRTGDRWDPGGLPELYLPTFSLHDLSLMLRSALVLAFLSSIDTLLTSLAATASHAIITIQRRSLLHRASE